MILYPSVEDVLQLHEKILLPETGGGSPGIRDKGAVDAALARAKQSAGGQDAFPTIYEKAAAIYESIAGIRHPFVDGNKRTAAVVLVAFLETNKVELEATDEELENMTLAVAGEFPPKPDFDEIVEWIREHSKPTKDDE